MASHRPTRPAVAAGDELAVRKDGQRHGVVQQNAERESSSKKPRVIRHGDHSDTVSEDAATVSSLSASGTYLMSREGEPVNS